MSTTYRPAASLTQLAQPVTALSFDPVSDILWAGSNVGNVVALYSPRGMRGVGFRVGGDLAVKKGIAGETGDLCFARAFFQSIATQNYGHAYDILKWLFPF